MSINNERSYYREDFIATKLFERVQYEADFNTVNNDFVSAQSPVTASYVRIGPMVFVSVEVDFSKVTGNGASFGTGQYYITLPFEGMRHSGFVGGMLHEDTTNRRTIQGLLEKDSRRMLLYYLDNQSELKAFTHSAPHNTLDTTDLLHIEGWYEGAVEL